MPTPHHAALLLLARSPPQEREASLLMCLQQTTRAHADAMRTLASAGLAPPAEALPALPPALQPLAAADRGWLGDAGGYSSSPDSDGAMSTSSGYAPPGDELLQQQQQPGPSVSPEPAISPDGRQQQQQQQEQERQRLEGAPRGRDPRDSVSEVDGLGRPAPQLEDPKASGSAQHIDEARDVMAA